MDEIETSVNSVRPRGLFGNRHVGSLRPCKRLLIKMKAIGVVGVPGSGKDDPWGNESQQSVWDENFGKANAGRRRNYQRGLNIPAAPISAPHSKSASQPSAKPAQHLPSTFPAARGFTQWARLIVRHIDALQKVNSRNESK
jgi:hypothetical protein